MMVFFQVLSIMSSKHYHYYRTGQHTLYTATAHDQQTLMAIYTYLPHWEIVYVTCNVKLLHTAPVQHFMHAMSYAHYIH